MAQVGVDIGPLAGKQIGISGHSLGGKPLLVQLLIWEICSTFGKFCTCGVGALQRSMSH